MTDDSLEVGGSRNRDTTTVSRDGVTAERTLVCEDDRITGALELTSTREGPVMVHVVDRAPSSVPVEAVSFEPGAEPDMGEITEQRATIRQTLGGEPKRIEFTIVPTEPVGEAKWASLEIESVREAGLAWIEDSAPAEPDSDLQVGSEDIFGDASRLERPVENSDADASNSGPTSAVDWRRTSDRAVTTEDEPAVPRSLEVRLDQLSARVEEFAAYARALEGIIDEYGTGTEIIDSVERDIDDLDERLASLSADLDERVDAVSEDVASLRTRHDADVQRVRRGVDQIGDAVEDVDERVDAMGATVAEQDEAIESVGEDVATLDDRLDRYEADLYDLRSTVEGIEDDFTALSTDVQELRTELEAIREEVSDLNDFRKSLAEISHVGRD